MHWGGGGGRGLRRITERAAGVPPGRRRATCRDRHDPARCRASAVIDFSIALSGPWAVALLADQGADVVKVEPPGIGDIGRWVGVAIGGMSAMAQIANRGKRSIALNLQKPEARRDVVAGSRATPTCSCRTSAPA